MSFRFEREAAIDDELGVIVRRHPLTSEGGRLTIWVEALPSKTHWLFTTTMELVRVLDARFPSRQCDAIAAVRIARRQAERVALQLADLKRGQGIDLPLEVWLETLHDGVYAYYTHALRLEDRASFAVTFQG